MNNFTSTVGENIIATIKMRNNFCYPLKMVTRARAGACKTPPKMVSGSRIGPFKREPELEPVKKY